LEAFMDIRPKYRHIYGDLKKQIDEGELKPGAKIPSTAVLCEIYDCSATAINTAVLLLTEEGYLIGAPGLGRFVAGA
jgi:DNA-binding GntR family transcriptional regulator